MAYKLLWQSSFITRSYVHHCPLSKVFGLSAGADNFSPHYRVHNGSGALSVGVKRPGREEDHSPPTTAEVKECVQLYLHSSNTPSWCGAQLKKKHRDNFTV